VDEHNGLRGKSIRGSAIRENTKGLVVGIERNGERILNPSSDTIFEWGDIVWLVGDKHRISLLNQFKLIG
jgi:CPA2 family monovalent cation:H+ antiporter-2